MTTLRRLLVLADAPLQRVAAAATLGALTVLCGVGLMGSAGYLISRAAEQPAILSLTVAIVTVRFFGLARPLARYAERLASHDLAFRVLARVRVKVYRRLEPLAPGRLEAYRSGDLLSRLVADVDGLQDLYLRGIGPPLVALLAGAVSVGTAFAFLPAAGLVLAAGLVAAGVAVPALAGAVGRRSARRKAALRGELSADVVELLRAGPELVAYGREREALAGVAAHDRALVRALRRDALAAGLADGLGVLVCGLTVAGVLAVAVAADAADRLDRVFIALLALLALASFEAVQPLASAVNDLARAIAAGGRVLELTDRRPAVEDPPSPAAAPGSFAVALEGVRARYAPDEPPVLDGVDLRLDAGARVALVGASGAGKTTVVHVLLRFLDPEGGRVSLGGRDLREYRQEDIRRAIAVAGQEAHLFSTTIRENVRLGRRNAGDDEIERALRLAGSWDWVEALPDGWDTLVGEEGRELSGGQRQRITIARALLSDAHVLVLDEPTAHLDPATAERLLRDIVGAAGERSVLLITHRPEALDLFDVVELAHVTTTAPEEER